MFFFPGQRQSPKNQTRLRGRRCQSAPQLPARPRQERNFGGSFDSAHAKDGRAVVGPSEICQSRRIVIRRVGGFSTSLNCQQEAEGGSDDGQNVEDGSRLEGQFQTVIYVAYSKIFKCRNFFVKRKETVSYFLVKLKCLAARSLKSKKMKIFFIFFSDRHVQ